MHFTTVKPQVLLPAHRKQYVALQKALFKVVGMYCITCKPIVEKQLKGQDAVKKIDIDFMTDSMIVEYDASAITKEEIKKMLENSGYRFVRVSR